MWWSCDAQFLNLRDFGVPYAGENGRFSKPSAFVNQIKSNFLKTP
jgi:hypothetical protein